MAEKIKTISICGTTYNIAASAEDVSTTSISNISATNVQGVLSEIANEKVDKTTTINDKPLSSNITLSKSDVGLGNVNNTADADKPMSTATQTYVDNQDALKADKLVLTNLVANGDLLIPKASPNENEPLGFKYTDSTDISLSNGIAKFTVASSGGGLRTSNISTIAGDKWYAYAYIKTTGSCYISGFNSNVYVSNSLYNQWTFISKVSTAITSATNIFGVFGSQNQTIEVDYMGAINLKAIFGAGNEPTKEQMDAIIKLKGYFDTTTIDLKDLMLLGFTQEARLTPTLTNATTTYLTYRKDDLGYVDIVGNLTITAFGTNFTLPEGYRPLTQLRLPILTSTNTLGYIIINTNGTVVSNANATIYINSRFATI